MPVDMNKHCSKHRVYGVKPADFVSWRFVDYRLSQRLNTNWATLVKQLLHSSMLLGYHTGLVLPKFNYSIPCSDSSLNSAWRADRKSTRLNSSHVSSSYAVFC